MHSDQVEGNSFDIKIKFIRAGCVGSRGQQTRTARNSGKGTSELEFLVVKGTREDEDVCREEFILHLFHSEWSTLS